MRDGGGVGWEPTTLTDIVARLRGGANELGSVAKGAPPGPDAGTSSEIVGQALAALVTAGATASAALETTAGKVNASLGAYDMTEKSNTKKMTDAGPGWAAAHAPR